MQNCIVDQFSLCLVYLDIPAPVLTLENQYLVKVEAMYYRQEVERMCNVTKENTYKNYFERCWIPYQDTWLC